LKVENTNGSLGTNGQGTQLLFIDDEESILRYLKRNLCAVGYDVVTSTGWEDAKLLLRDPDVQPDLIFIEPLLKDDNGGPSLQEICAEANQIPVIVLSTSRDVRSIVHAVRAGARDYLSKPVQFKKLFETISTSLDSRIDPEITHSKATSRETELVFCSPGMERICKTVHQIASTRVPVLIQGESGVGKDLIARMLHQESDLRDKPFVKVNCAAIPSELVESELFGYRKGAFTGAHLDRPGKFEFANGGTIFLDEIGEFTSSIQAKLLQVLQEGKFTRLGSNQETTVQVRIVAATNRKLEKALKEGTFREDLYYRLNVVGITVPPLRERREEIPLLCKHFLKRIGPQYGTAVTQLPKDLEKLLYAFHWPGNVRELENAIKRYVVLRDPESLRADLENRMARGVSEQINEIAASALRGNESEMDLKTISRRAAVVAETGMILKTLEKMKWNRWKTAKELKVSYKTLLTKIEQYQIRPSP
jgi:two-component system response regulator AtoC